MRRAVALTTTALVLFVAPGGRAAPVIPAETGRFYTILPPGQHGYATIPDAAVFFTEGTRPPHFDDQLGMYADLLYSSSLADPLDPADLEKYFKRAGFEVDPADVTRVETPRAGLTIVRDGFDVPHIYGDTASDVFFGTGFVTGEDRLFVTDVLRHLGRGRLSEFLGASQANLALDRDIALVAGYSEEELQTQLDQLAIKFGENGERSIQAIRDFTAGMNAWIDLVIDDPTKLPAEYPVLQVLPDPWRETDVVAVATLIQAIFAAGGGGELQNMRLLQELSERYGSQKGLRVIRDLLQHEDADAPTTTDASFPYLRGGGEPNHPSVAMLDPGSFDGHDPLRTLRQSLTETLGIPGAMSNWLAVTADRSADGHPIAVMGPQTGYFSPNLLMEIDIHGGGYDARGATFPGISMFVLLGRGIDYAWSATSGGSDMIDIRAEKLCEPDGSAPSRESNHYLYGGECVEMYSRVDRYVAKPSAGGLEPSGLPAEPTVVTQTVRRTVHGPVIGTGTVEGQPVALSFQRSTFFGEADSSPAFIELNSNAVTDPDSFFVTMNKVTGSFNWLYVDDTDVAFFHSGLYPIRAPGVEKEYPVWGTGEWEWRGFLTVGRHPHAVVGSGSIVSWNNKPARDWHAADANYSYSPVYRSQSLSERLAATVPDGGVTITEMIDIMEDSATVDLRGSQVVAYALRVLDGASGVEVYTSLLADWVAEGAHRRAPSRDAAYDHEAAIALADAWWERLIHAIFDDELEGLYHRIPLGFDDGNRTAHIGSAFQGGWYGHAQKALRQRLGDAIGSPYVELGCGADLVSCRDVVAASLLDAAAALEAEFGGGPETWRVAKSSEEIRHSAIGLITVPAIDWQNRPTFQQVVQVMGPRAS